MPRWETRDYSDMPMPAEVDRAWAAGLYDGEGSTNLKRPRKGSDAIAIRMYLSQKDAGPEILDRLQRVLGVGTVRERQSRPGVWAWTCNDRAGCTRALDVMWPYLSSPKRDQARKVGYNVTT